MAESKIKMVGTKKAVLGWGTSLTFTLSSDEYMALAIVGGEIYSIWLGGNTDISVQGIKNGQGIAKVIGNGSVTAGGHTFSRNGKTVTISDSSMNAMTVFY